MRSERLCAQAHWKNWVRSKRLRVGQRRVQVMNVHVVVHGEISYVMVESEIFEEVWTPKERCISIRDQQSRSLQIAVGEARAKYGRDDRPGRASC